MWRDKKDEHPVTPSDMALEKGDKTIRESINELLDGIQELKKITQGEIGDYRGK